MAIEYEDGRAKTVRTKEEKLKKLKEQWSSFSDKQKKLIKRVLKDDPEKAERLIKSLNQSQYKRQPPTIREFVNDPYYAGEQIESMYPVLKQDLINIFENDYFEVLLTGGSGYGKSFLSTFGLMYEILRLSCYRKPAQAFGLAPNSNISFSLMSTTRRQARRTLFQDIKLKIKNSNFFKNEIGVSEDDFDKSKIQITDNITVTCEKTSEEAFIGTNMFGLIMDEVNYGVNKKESESEGIHDTSGFQTRAEKIYRKAIKRIKSRFMDSGIAHGKVFVISSRNTLQDFTDKRIAEAKDDPHVYVMDYTQWEPKPNNKFSGETFRVFFGGRNLKSRILEEDQDPPETDDPLAEVIEVPIEFYDDFSSDIAGALRDIAGKSVPKVTPWIHDTDIVDFMFIDRDDEHPMPGYTWISGSRFNINWSQLCEYKKIEYDSGHEEEKPVPIKDPDSVRHAHIDMSKTGDATGLCIGHIEKMVEVVVRNNIKQTKHKELRPLIYIDFLLRIEAPSDGEINYDGIRSIIYDFIDKGYPIQYISTDRYQSVDMQQQFNQKGLKSETRSLDVNNDGYDILKSTLKQKRIRSYEYPRLQKELIELQQDNIKNKVDHPEGGSKDIADAVAGVTWSLTDQKPMNESPVIQGSERKKNNQLNNDHPLNKWKDVSDTSDKNNLKKGNKEYRKDDGKDDYFWGDDDDPMFIMG